MKKELLSIIALLLILCPISHGKSPAGRVDALMSSLSIERKIAQLMVITSDNRYNSKRQDEENRAVAESHLGGLIIMGKELGPALERANYLQNLSDIPLLEFIDGEWGAAMRLTGYEAYPRQADLSLLPGDSLVYEMGRAVGRELRELKVNVNFAPVLDINNNPDNIVIGSRSFGPDKHKVAEYGAAYMKGMQDEGIIACAKHFPGHGDTSVDSHNGLPVLNFDRKRLDEFELFPFRYAIDREVGMIMVGHLCVPALDTSGTPASISRPIITGFLKEELGYDGLVVCDALNMKSIIKRCGGAAQASLEAYKAGADILLMPFKVEESIALIAEWVRAESKRMEDLDKRVRKVLEAKAAAGMFDPGYKKTTELSDLHPEASADFIKNLRLAIEAITSAQADAQLPSRQDVR